MYCYGLLRDKVFWVDWQDKRVVEGTLEEFNERYTCVKECCSPRGVEPVMSLEEVEVWTVGDFHEITRDLFGAKAHELNGKVFFSAEDAEDEAHALDEDEYEDDNDHYVSGGTLYVLCAWNPNGSKERTYYSDRKDALAELERIWRYDIWNDENAPMPHHTREDAEAELKDLAEEDEE